MASLVQLLGPIVGSISVVLLIGCTDASPGTAAAGGNRAVTTGGQSAGNATAGGTTTVGGNSATGDALPTGGSASAGGASQAGGSTARGGTTFSGGTNATGGNVATGGRSAASGTNSTGGLVATGGVTSTGGAITTGGSFNCITKRGFASGLEVASASSDIAALAAPQHGVSWYYGWAKSPSTQMGMAFVNAGVEFVPMIWGKAAELIDTNLAGNIYVGSNTRYLLGFNEPNFNSQANLTPAQAAAAWPNVEKAADQLGLQLVAPAVNFCGGGCNATDPFQWIDQFLAACSNCRVDYVAFHSYACDANWFINSYMKPAVLKYYTNGNPPRKIWLTEFACADSPPSGGWTVPQIDSYMRTVLDYLENEPGIFRYAWFGSNTGRNTGTYVTANNDLLATGSSQLTSLGMTYTSLAEASSCP